MHPISSIDTGYPPSETEAVCFFSEVVGTWPDTTVTADAAPVAPSKGLATKDTTTLAP